MNPSLWGLILASVGLSAGAQIALKHGMSRPSTQAALSAGGLDAALAVAGQPHVLLGLAMYGVGAMLWLLVLARIEVSMAYPFVGLGFLLVMALGVLVLGEPLNTPRVLGTLLVASGVLCVALGGRT